MAAPRPLGAQIYFIGATNVPMDVLDPALTRPGRMGRHVWFRTPTKDDRKDIFDLYLDRVAHDPGLDSPERRDEIVSLGGKTIVSGTLATCIAGSVVGILY